MSILSSINFEKRMKRFVSILALLLVSFAFVAAQGNGGNNGNGNGNGNGGYSSYGQGNGPWLNVNWPQWLINWLENGGQVPPVLAADVIWEARSWGQQNFGLSYLQMLQKYAQGQLTLTYISTSPPSLTFRVTFGGLNVVIIDSF
jgi:hypothetical protein